MREMFPSPPIPSHTWFCAPWSSSLQFLPSTAARWGGVMEAPHEHSHTPAQCCVPAAPQAPQFPGGAASHNSSYLPAAVTAEPTYCRRASPQEYKYNHAELHLCAVFLLGLIRRNTAAHSHVELPTTVSRENFISPINVNWLYVIGWNIKWF